MRRVVQCDEGNLAQLEFEVPITIKNPDHLLEETLKKTFGSSHVMLLDAGAKAKTDPTSFQSVLVHELGHYRDYLKDKKMFHHTEEEKIQEARNFAEKRKVALNQDYKNYIGSEPFKNWYSDWKEYVQEAYPTVEKASLDRLLMPKVFQMYQEDFNSRFPYHNNKLEKSAFIEQASFFKKELGLDYDKFALAFEQLDSPAIETKLKSGKKVKLTPPAFPHNEQFYREIYDPKGPKP